MATALPKQNTLDFRNNALQAEQLKDDDGNAVNISDLIAGAVTITSGIGTAGTGVTNVTTTGNGLNKTVLTLTAVAVPILGGATGSGEGGALIYTFPEGLINFLGGSASLVVSEAHANITATAVVTVGVGSAEIAGDDDALGADATDDNYLNGAAVTLASSTGTLALVSNAAVNFDGTATASPMWLNASVADAGVDNDTAAIAVSGTVTFWWINLGDD